jgi:hypothetical protein
MKSLLSTAAIIGTWCLLFLIPGCKSSSSSSNYHQINELRALDSELGNAAIYDARKSVSIDSVKKILNSLDDEPSPRRREIYTRLGDMLTLFSSDSAVYYYNKALLDAQALKDDSLIYLSQIDRIHALAAAGIFNTAERELECLDTITLSRDMTIDRAKAGRQLYSYMLSYLEGQEGLVPDLRAKFERYDSTLINLLDSRDPMQMELRYERLVRAGRYTEAKPRLENLIKTIPDSSNLYGRTAFQLAEVYRNLDDPDNYVRNLARASISDIKCSVKEAVALPTLAVWLYRNGDTDHAYEYINTSLQSAKSGNARMRTVSFSNYLPLIADAYGAKINKSRDLMSIFLIIAVTLFIIAVILLFNIIYRAKKLADARNRLRILSKTQEAYIGHFIGLCSNYSSKLNSINRLIARKLASGQADELLKMVKSGKFTEEHADDFYEIFDKAFLDLYPDFVFEINRLLRDDCHMEVKKDAGLNAELRIYALVRLGVDESVKISKVLNYSVSTVYTYRNKMRNKAKNRDTFEEDVMKICSEN